MKNDNRKRKTESDLWLFKQFLKEVEVELEAIELERLDEYMADFFLGVRKPNATQY